MKKYFILVLAILGIGFVPHLSLAATAFDYGNDGTIVTPQDSTNGVVILTPLGQPTHTITSGSPWYWKFEVANSGICDTTGPIGEQWNIRGGPNSDYASWIDTPDTDYEFSGGLSGGYAYWTSGDIPFTLSSSEYYAIIGYCSNGTNFVRGAPYSTAYSFAGGSYVNFGTNNHTSQYSLPSDFCISDTSGQCVNEGTDSGGSSLTIDVGYPVDASTISDFTNWGLEINNATSSHIYEEQVLYSQFGTGQSYLDVATSTGFNSSTTYPVKTTVLAGSVTSTWVVSASLYDESETGTPLVATSSAVTFSIEPSSLDFVYPTYGTSTGLFNPWQFQVNGVNPFLSYAVQVSWEACPLGSPSASANCTGWLTSLSNAYTGVQVASSGIWANRTEFSSDFANNVTVYAVATLLTNSGQTLAIETPTSLYTPVASTSIQFTLLSIPNSSPSSTLGVGGTYIITSSTGNGTYSLSSSTGNAAMNVAGTSTISEWCPQTDTLTNPLGYFAYGLCQVVQYTFNPNVIPASTAFLKVQVNLLEQVPPFSGFFDVASSVNNGLANFSNATTSGVSIGILGYNSDNVAAPVDIVDVNQTTFENGQGTSQHTDHPTSDAINFMETYVAAWLWIGAGFRVLWIFTHG